MNKSIYKEIVEAKNGTQIPVLENGKTIDSRYNPERDAEKLITGTDCSFNFFIAAGIGCGIYIEKLSELRPDAVIIALEATDEDINFLKKLPSVQKLSENSKIIFSSLGKLKENLISNYNPAYYGSFKVIEQPVWISENKELLPEIKNTIEASLAEISADYSTQAFFGKIWQKNIINNLKSLCEAQISLDFDTSKTAVIVAAGSSLDSKIEKLKSDSYFIISTDTAFSSLIKHKIIPDIVVSIDGQWVSLNHFKYYTEQILQKTVFLMDLCSNSSVSRKLKEKKAKAVHYISNHPMAVQAGKYFSSKPLRLFSGSGTVTITAFDFAWQAGFKDVEVIGADFSYINCKPYAKGTYLDSLYSFSSSKLNSAEKSYTSLMFRTKTEKLSEKVITTKLLASYKKSFEEYLSELNAEYSCNDNIYKIRNVQAKKIQNCYKANSFSINNFIENTNELSFMPYIAWLRKQPEFSHMEFKELYKLARKSLVRYN